LFDSIFCVAPMVQDVEVPFKTGSNISAGVTNVIMTDKQTGDSFIQGGKGFARRNSMIQTCALIIADVVGTGVLGIGTGFAQFGWVVGTIFFMVCLPLNWLSGHCLNKIHLHYFDQRKNICTLGDAAKEIWGAGWVGYVGLPLYLFCVLCSYIQVVGSTVQQLFYETNMCLYWACAISCLVLLPFVQLRSLNNLALLSAVSFATICITILICLWQLISDDVDCPSTKLPSPYDNFWELFGAASMFIFAFAGQTIFLEMNAEMKEPLKFQRALNIAYAIMGAMYYAVSSAVFGACGAYSPSDKLTTLVPRGPVLRFVAIMMLIHMIISYTISCTVFVRSVFVNTGYTAGVEDSIKGRLMWFTLSSVVLVLTAFFANAVPSFNLIVALVTDLLICPLCFLLPCGMFLTMNRKFPADHPLKAGPLVQAACWFVLVLFSIQMVVGGGVDLVKIFTNPDALSCNPQW